MKWTPKPYQERALQFVLDNPRCQLWLDKGLGKTSVALHAIDQLMQENVVQRVLVVSTRRITKSVWPAEVEKWGLQIPLRDIEGSPTWRAQLLNTKWVGIETITFEKLKWLFDSWVKPRGRGRPLPWQLIVFDESSKLKAPGTQRFRALRRWQHALPRVVHLTGSPAPSGLLNLWGPAFLLDHGERLGRTYTGFKERWFRTADPMGWKLEPLPGADAFVHEKLDDITISLRAADYLEMPPLVVNDVPVDLPTSVRAGYRVLERDMFLELSRGTVEAANGGVLTSKCRQMANGALYLNGEQRDWEILHDEKLEALDEVMEEAEGQPIIVAYQFRSDLARLQARYKHAAYLHGAKDPDRVVAEWNDGKHQMLLIHPASAGHGLNLQDGGCHMAFFGCPWSFDQYDQCLDRIAGGLRRQRPTFIHRIIARDTVDEDVVTALEGHRTVQEVLKERLSRRYA
jgi:SNF2 family DNA or RNA helicase